MAVSLEYIVCDSILMLDLRDDVHFRTKALSLARIASALVECSKGLDDYYKELVNLDQNQQQLCLYHPHPTLDSSRATGNSPLPKLDFEGTLVGDDVIAELTDPTPSQLRDPKIATTVITENGEEKTVRAVVKFVVKYGEKAHKLLDDVNLAPKLYYCRPVLGGMTMVVMEYLDGWKRMASLDEIEQSKRPSVLKDIESAVRRLREENLVHGDLRAVNVMIDPEESHAKVIDFDWADEHGKGRYPVSINKIALSKEWHKDVDPCAVMMTEHDEFACNEVLKKKLKL